MRKYILLPFVLFLLSIQIGIADNFVQSYIDTNNWSVYDFSLHPPYRYKDSTTLAFRMIAIDFLDSLHGVASVMCYDSTNAIEGLIKTDNGGNSWYLLGKDTSINTTYSDFMLLKYIDTNLIFTTNSNFYSSVVTKVSRNENKNWNYKNIGNYMDVVDNYGKNFIVVARSDSAFVSTDNAISWQGRELSNTNNNMLLYMYVVKPNDIITVHLDSLWNYSIYHSYDTLKTENYFGTLQNHHLSYTDSLGNHYGARFTYFTFATPEIGWCSYCDTSKDIQSHYDYIYRTDDGGRTWAMQYKVHHMPDMNSFPECKLKIQAYDTLNVIAYGDVNKIVRTSDGGRTWKELVDYAKDSFGCNSLAFIDQYHFYLTTEYYGKILKSKPMFLGIDKPEQYSSENSMLIYPNPFRDYFNIKDGSGKTIEVYSPEGRLLVNTLYSSPIDLSGFSAGIYFVKIDGRMYKIVKI